jgi:Fic family protein
LIPLYLVSQKILDKPLLYLSTYFEKNRGLYYDNLMLVREQNNMIAWLKYFLAGIEQTSIQATRTLGEILKFKSAIEQQAPVIFKRRSHAAIRLFNELYKKPFVKVESASKICNLSYKAANDLIALMGESGYLRETTGQNRNRLFVFEPYLRIFEG